LSEARVNRAYFDPPYATGFLIRYPLTEISCIMLSDNHYGGNGFVSSYLKVWTTYLVVITKGGWPDNDLETVFRTAKSPPLENISINRDRL